MPDGMTNISVSRKNAKRDNRDVVLPLTGAKSPEQGRPQKALRVPRLISRMYEAMLWDHCAGMDFFAAYDETDGHLKDSVPWTILCADGYSFVAAGAQRNSHASRYNLFFHEFVMRLEDRPGSIFSNMGRTVQAIEVDRLIQSHGGPAVDQIASLGMADYVNDENDRQPPLAAAAMNLRGAAEDLKMFGPRRPKAAIAPPKRYQDIGVKGALGLLKKSGVRLSVKQDAPYGIALVPSSDVSTTPVWLRQYIEEHAIAVMNYLARAQGWDLYDLTARKRRRVAQQVSPWHDKIAGLLDARMSIKRTDQHFEKLWRLYLRLRAWASDQPIYPQQWVSEIFQRQMERCRWALLEHRSTSVKALRVKFQLIAEENTNPWAIKAISQIGRGLSQLART